MQIDFHHAVTYVTARLAKFSVEEAKIISYSAQYVDDAINSGVIKFRNNAMYSRISSAHRTLDYRNFKNLANHHVWVPFHFLPGNGGKKAGDNPDGSFIQKMVCYPNSTVAEDMVRYCIESHDRKYGLHRLGITMHVLADTFSHQGFTGTNHQINEVVNLKKQGETESSLKWTISDYFRGMFDTALNKVVSDTLPLGHGGALSCPDIPFLKWEYENGLGKSIKRDNTKIFLSAVKSMHESMVRYRMKNAGYTLQDADRIPAEDLKKIRNNFETFVDEKGEHRHEKWVKSIANGDFSFLRPNEEIISYIPKGMYSWKYNALDTTKETETKTELYRFTPAFMDSDWKLFHDALQIHRIDILKHILPEYGICAA